MNIFAQFRQFLGRRTMPRIQVDGGCISVFCADVRVQVAKAEEVNAIIAFQRDLVTEDQLVLNFLDERKQLLLSVNEDMIGFAIMLQKLPEMFEGLTFEWKRQVHRVPFEENVTTVWERSRP
jgi:hypothetical protein